MTLLTRRSAIAVVATFAAAVAAGGIMSGLAATPRISGSPPEGGVPTVHDTPVAVVADDPGCRPPVAPFADPNFSPVGGRFGPTTVAYPSIVETGEVITEESAQQLPDTLLPTEIPEAWANRLYVRDSSDRNADGRGEARLRMYLSPRPVQGSILDFTEAGGVLLVQTATTGFDSEFVAAEIADTGRQFSFVDVGPHRAIMYLADPVVRDELRPWHMYWSDGVRDWSLQGVADPEAMIALAQSMYC